MGKFVIECPNCGRFAEGKTGFFARKKIDCACGYTINVRTDKLTSRECPHCKNTVVFDQTKGDDAVCPVCHKPINTFYEQSKTAEISCAQCGVRLLVNKGAETYVCPVCDYENDVVERIKSEEIKRDGLASIIKYEGDNDTLVWKHPIEDFNYGSQLIVHESQEAIFFKDGQALDLFGAGRYTLETQQLPLLEKVYRLPTDTEGTFHSEVYYINLSVIMGVKWGTDSKIRMFDPASGLHLELGASGEFNIRVIDSRKLLTRLVGTTGGLRQQELLGIGNGKSYFRAMIMTQVKAYLAQAIKACGINILEIDENLINLSAELKEKLNGFLKDYGLEMPEFFVSNVVTPDDDPNFKRMKQQYAEQYLLIRQEQIKKSEAEAAAQRKEVEATTAARMKIIGAQGEAEALRAKAQAEADAYKMQAEAEAMEMKMKGYTYQQETSRQVGLEAMKNGIGGNGVSGAGALGDLASLGVGLGAMSGVIGMTKDALNPTISQASQIGQTVNNNIMDLWDCSCGQKGVSGNFCNNCGAKRPEKKSSDMWDCSCGQKGIVGNFCNNCGAKRPVPISETW
ncbi:MAG: SPFH domain-containing protein, partial [Ruminiclostridium sp.]|nr:SPFH domain-containing protein [Ruminiclostridium sp.]